MAYKHGAYGEITASRVADARQAAVTAAYIGTAPVNLVRGYANLDLINMPLKIANMSDAQSKLGYCADWKRFTLCEAFAQHFDNSVGNVGPIYVVNVLDPTEHRADAPVSQELTFTNQRAEFESADIILDSFSMEDMTEGVDYSLEYNFSKESVVVRLLDNSESAAAAVKNTQRAEVRKSGPHDTEPNYDYPAQYEAAGVHFDGSGITFDANGTIDAGITHDGYAFLGLVFPAPENATRVTVTVNGAATDQDVDLKKNADNVINGDFVKYFAFAKADGTLLRKKTFVLTFSWTLEGGGTLETECVIRRLTGKSDDVLTCTYQRVDPSKVEVADIIGRATADGQYTGLYALSLLYQYHNAVLNMLAAPGWSHIPEVYKAMVRTVQKLNGHWGGFVNADIPVVDSDGVPINTIQKAIAWQEAHDYNSEYSKVYWPQITDKEGRVFHLATAGQATMLRVDLGNDGIPFETPSNKEIMATGQYFGPDAQNKGFDQETCNDLNEKGITTACFWAGRWVIWGPHTAAYTYGGTMDARAVFDVNLRMLMYITNRFQLDHGTQIAEPLTPQDTDTILNAEKQKLDTLVGMGALIGSPSVEFLETENTASSMMNGDFVWNFSVTNTPPLKSATVRVAYTDEGFSAFFESE